MGEQVGSSIKPGLDGRASSIFGGLHHPSKYTIPMCPMPLGIIPEIFPRCPWLIFPSPDMGENSELYITPARFTELALIHSQPGLSRNKCQGTKDPEYTCGSV